jgi:hypothetical protein
VGPRTRDPVIRLSREPLVTVPGPDGNPFYFYGVCPECLFDLIEDDDPAGHGTMFVCYRGCGQRYWLEGTGTDVLV